VDAGRFPVFRAVVIRIKVILLVLLGATGCRQQDEEREPSQDSAVTAATPAETMADRAPSMDSLLWRFQAGVPEPSVLNDASPSAEALTRRYLDAVARSDMLALRGMHITRAEYAHLYFPSSKMMKPPYELPPDVAWLLLTAESNKGIGSVMRRFGGRGLTFESVGCPGEPLREGPTIVWRDCVVRFRSNGASVQERPLFAAIIERDGRFKFFSYATPL
jgi:hypothetical protein